MPQASSLIHYVTGVYAAQGQPDNLFRNTCFYMDIGAK